MNRSILFTLIILLLAFKASTSFSQQPDSLQVTTVFGDTLTADQTEAYDEEMRDDFEPGLALFALFIIGFMFICIGVGVVLTIIGIMILFGLIAAGILSTSILVGLHNKSFEKGFTTFLISVTTLGGLLIGSIGFWGLNKIMHWFTTQTALIIGSSGGLLTGLLLGILLSYVIRKVTALLKERLANV